MVELMETNSHYVGRHPKPVPSVCLTGALDASTDDLGAAQTWHPGTGLARFTEIATPTDASRRTNGAKSSTDATIHGQDRRVILDGARSRRQRRIGIVLTV